MSTIGTRIDQKLKELGMSQEELAERAKVSQSTIHKLVSGKSTESRKLPQLASALNVDIFWLATGVAHAITEPKAAYSATKGENTEPKIDDLFNLIWKKYKLGELSDGQIKLIRNIVDELAIH